MHSYISFFLSGLLTLLLAAVIPAYFHPTLPLSDHVRVDFGGSRFLSSIRNAPVYTGCTAQSTPIVNSEYEHEVVELVNAERAERGLPPLKRNLQLDEAARYHSTDMKQDSYFDHNSHDRVDNQLQLVCSWATRVENYYTGSVNMGENIAYGYGSPEDVVEGWMNSSGHRANILNADYIEIGVGYGPGNHWTQDFGTRPDVHPIIINGEARTADSRDVILYIYGSWKEIRIRNDGGPWSSWMPFQNTIPWQLPDQRGSHTVTIEIRSGAKLESSSDEIILGGSEATEPSGPKLYLPFLVNPRS